MKTIKARKLRREAKRDERENAQIAVGTICTLYAPEHRNHGDEVVVTRGFAQYNSNDEERYGYLVRFRHHPGEEGFVTAGQIVEADSQRNYSHLVVAYAKAL